MSTTENNDVANVVRSRVTPRIVQQHERHEPHSFTRRIGRHERRNQAPYADRFCCQIGSNQVLAPRGCIAFVEDEVNHRQHRFEEQDRTRWNQQQIAEALPLVAEALRQGRGSYALQAAIAAEHCKAARPEDTDWGAISHLYDELERLHPSPVIALNRAVAIAMADGPVAGLARIEMLAADGDLDTYHLLHAARADLLRRLGSRYDAARSYQRALELVTNQSERRYLERRLRELDFPAN